MENNNTILEFKTRHIKLLTVLVSILFVLVIFAACSANNDNKKQTEKQHRILTIAAKKQTSSLYFDGTVFPIRISIVASPIDGTIEKMFFRYGTKIKKAQLLLTINSATLGKNYQEAISTYLTAKEKYTTSKNNIAGAKDLYDSGITSRQTYQAAESDLNDSYLSFLQAQLALFELLKSAGITEHDLYLLQINDPEAVRKTLQTPLKAINVYAPMNGIALKPIKSSSDSDSSQSIQTGASLKQGQAIVSIGKMSGITININVDEIRINQIKIGDLATVTSDAFPGIKLSGNILSISSQANTNSDSGGLPTFPAVIVVKNLTPAQQQVIHVGMSAKVQINSSTPAEIIIPLEAVKIIKDITYVNLIDPKTEKTVQHPVQVGATTVDGINVISGLKPGDKIVIGH